MKPKSARTVTTALLAIVFCLTLVAGIAGMLPSAALAADGSYQTFDTWVDDDITKISTTSDVHFGESNTRERFKALLEVMQTFQPQMLLVTGDTHTTSYSPPTTDVYGSAVGHSFSSSYAEIKAAAHYYLGADIPVVIIAGNHEYDSGSTYYTSNSGFSSYYGLVPTKNFDVFLFGAPNGGSGSYSYSTDEIDALDAYLSERDEQDKPAFVQSHYPIDDAATGESHGNAGNAAAVIDVLDDYDQPTFYLWGHNHNLASNRTSMSTLVKQSSAGYTTMNAGAVNYRSPTNLAQCVNLTLDPDADTLTYSVKRIDTSNPGVVTSIGSGTQDLPDYEPSLGAETPTISGQPADATVAVGGSALLTVAASVGDGGTLSYQWFSNAADSNSGGASIAGASGTSYAAPTATAGTKYYYCEVTNTISVGGGATDTAMKASNAARVTVGDGSAWDGSVATSFAAGAGTSGDPYLISDGSELAYLAQQVSGGITTYSGTYFKQTADIDLDSRAWTPIGAYAGSSGGTANRTFAGTYEGDGYIVANLKVAQSFLGSASNNKCFALFGNLGGTVQNLGVIGVDVSVSNTQTGTSNGNAYAGGIAAYVSAGIIRNCYAEGAVSATSNAGGSSVRVAGGLAARLSGSSTVVNSYAAATASVNSGSYVGGLTGWRESGTFTTSYWNSSLTSAGVQNSTSQSGTTAKTTAEMQLAAFVDLLNANRGTYKEWMADSVGLNQGYPIHEREATVTDALPPTITGQPQNVRVGVGDDADLTVTATVARGILSYQWYSNAADANTGGSLIGGATSSSYSAPTGSTGTTYYYCVVTNTDTAATGNQTATRTSDAARVLVSSMSVWDGSIASSFAGGSGTSVSPYLISDGSELAYLAQRVNAGTTYSGMYFTQTADIDLGGREWTPIGQYVGSSATNYPFSGTYDGDGSLIAGLSIDQTVAGTSTNNKGFGLFGLLAGTVKNVGLTGIDIAATNTSTSSSNGNAYVGGIAAYVGHGTLSLDGYISNCFVVGTAAAATSNSSGRCNAGGLGGYFAEGAIANSYAAVTASIGGTYSSSNSGAGGLTGYRDNGAFTTSYWNSTLTSGGVASSTSTSGTTAKTTAQMKAAAFVELLNANRGSYKAWAADSSSLNEGYPIHSREAAPVDAETPEISGQPANVTVNVGGTANLSVTATVDQGVLSYQWFSNATNSNSGGSLIGGATSSSYAAPTGTAGTTYYYCVVTNTDAAATGNQTATATSTAARVIVSEAIDLSAATIAAIPNQIYTGLAKKPALTVRLGSVVLQAGTDYTAAYSSNVLSGKATVIVTGVGNYTGSVATTFKILPKKSEITKVVAGSKKLTVTWKKHSGSSGYVLAYSTKKWTGFKTTTTTAASKTVTGLKRGTVYYVKVRAYIVIDGVRCYGAWSALKSARVK